MPNYGQGLRNALDQARTALLQQRNTALIARRTSATTLGHAEDTLIADNDAVTDALQRLDKVTAIYDLSTQGTSIVQNADTLAAQAAAEATASNSSIDSLAGSIKALVVATDTFVSELAGVRKLAKINDKSTDVDDASHDASVAARALDETVEQLRLRSLSVCVQSAKSTASAASQAVTTLGTNMQSLMDAAATLFTDTLGRAETARTADTAAGIAEKKSVEAYAVSELSHQATLSSLRAVDEFVNWSLSARPPTGTTKSMGIIVSLDWAQTALSTRGDDDATSSYCLFAVATEDAAAFTFGKASAVVKKAMLQASKSTDSGKTPDPTQPYTYLTVKAPWPTSTTPPVVVEYDTSGQPLALAESYAIFALRLLQGGILAADAADFSLCTNAVPTIYPFILWDTTGKLLTNLWITQGDNTPAGKKLAAGATPATDPTPATDSTPATDPAPKTDPTKFTVTFVATPQLAELALEYRVILLRQDVYSAIKDDLPFLANQLNQAFYKLLTKEGTSTTYSVAYDQTVDLDAYSQPLGWDKHYVCAILLVGGSEDPVTLTYPGAPATKNVASSPENTPNALSQVVSFIPDDLKPPQLAPAPGTTTPPASGNGTAAAAKKTTPPAPAPKTTPPSAGT